MNLVLAAIATALTVNSQAITYLPVISTGLTTGSTSVPYATTVQENTLSTIPCICDTGSTCYRPVCDKPFAFELKIYMNLPQVGQSLNGALFDQIFYDTTRIHEDWHYKYDVAVANGTYGKLEAWSAQYVGGCFHTVGEALAAGRADMENARDVANFAFASYLPEQDTWDAHENSGWEIQNVGGVNTYRSVNWDWGAELVANANKINTVFFTSPGTCACIPEPDTSSLVLFLVGNSFLLMRIRHKNIGQMLPGK
jgi:hypothetical protein